MGVTTSNETYRECLEVDEAATEKQDDKIIVKQRTLVLKNILKELWIKQSVINNHIDLFDVDNFKLLDKWKDGKWIFGVIIEDVYHMLEVDTDGRLGYFFDDGTMLFPKHSYNEEIQLLEKEREKKGEKNGKKRKKQSAIEAFMISPDKRVYTILNEKERVLPDLVAIESELLGIEHSLEDRYKNGKYLAGILEKECRIDDKEKWAKFIEELKREQSLTKKGF